MSTACEQFKLVKSELANRNRLPLPSMPKSVEKPKCKNSESTKCDIFTKPNNSQRSANNPNVHNHDFEHFFKHKCTGASLSDNNLAKINRLF